MPRIHRPVKLWKEHGSLLVTSEGVSFQADEQGDDSWEEEWRFSDISKCLANAATSQKHLLRLALLDESEETPTIVFETREKLNQAKANIKAELKAFRATGQDEEGHKKVHTSKNAPTTKSPKEAVAKKKKNKTRTNATREMSESFSKETFHESFSSAPPPSPRKQQRAPSSPRKKSTATVPSLPPPSPQHRAVSEQTRPPPPQPCPPRRATSEQTRANAPKKQITLRDKASKPESDPILDFNTFKDMRNSIKPNKVPDEPPPMAVAMPFAPLPPPAAGSPQQQTVQTTNTYVDVDVGGGGGSSCGSPNCWAAIACCCVCWCCILPIIMYFVAAAETVAVESRALLAEEQDDLNYLYENTNNLWKPP